MNANGLSPTLWRTCRVLANHKRLAIIQDLMRQPEQPVSGIAVRHNIKVSLASIYLRALNARGVLSATRRGKMVYYSVMPNPSIPWVCPLVHAMSKIFVQRRNSSALIYKHATAFTHPRRIEIYRALLLSGPLDKKQLAVKSGISRQALIRHLDKFQDRGFVVRCQQGWMAITPKDLFGKTLVMILSQP